MLFGGCRITVFLLNIFADLLVQQETRSTCFLLACLFFLFVPISFGDDENYWQQHSLSAFSVEYRTRRSLILPEIKHHHFITFYCFECLFYVIFSVSFEKLKPTPSYFFLQHHLHHYYLISFKSEKWLVVEHLLRLF